MSNKQQRVDNMEDDSLMFVGDPCEIYPFVLLNYEL